MTKRELEQMAEYFRRTYFDNIPRIPYLVLEDRYFDKAVEASFVMQQSEDYDSSKDELYESPEYNKRFEIEEGIGFDYGSASWTDPLNHPDLAIEIRKSLLKNELKLVGVLLHELTHYWCWFCGYDHRDGSKEFENKLKELGLPSNWQHAKFEKSQGKWVDDFDYSTMQSYYAKFKESEPVKVKISKTEREKQKELLEDLLMEQKEQMG